MTASPACLSRQVGDFLPPAGGLPFLSPADLAVAVPGGEACLLCRLPPPPLACFPAPYPPAPLPRRGRGSPKVYFAGGFAPGAPALNRLRHLQSLPLLYPAGACPAGHPPDLAAAVPGGGLPALPPPYPAISFAFCPLSPRPLPRRGRGSPKVYFAGGFAPGTPALNRLRHLLVLPRGRGPSQTPKFLSPGPPSPWLPALLKGKPFCRFHIKP